MAKVEVSLEVSFQQSAEALKGNPVRALKIANRVTIDGNVIPVISFPKGVKVHEAVELAGLVKLDPTQLEAQWNQFEYVVFVQEDLLTKDPQLASFIVFHELGHYVNEALVGDITDRRELWRELAADEFAIRHTSVEAQEAIVKLLEAHRDFCASNTASNTQFWEFVTEDQERISHIRQRIASAA